MALVLADRVRETTTVTGTGTATLLGAVSGYQSFSAVGNANTTYYVIANQSATEWEVGIGTYTSSGTTLSRDTVLSSSNSGSLVNFSAGTKDVFCDYPASKAVFENASGNIDSYPITGGTIDNTTIGATTPSTGVFTTLGVTTSINASSGSANADLNVNSKGNGNVNIGTGNGTQFRVGDTFAGGTATNFYKAQGTAGGGVVLVADGASTNVQAYLSSKGASPISFTTFGLAVEQFRIAHTASAVNYVQVTGAATGSSPAISAQGSDTNIALELSAKGTSSINFRSGSSAVFQAIMNTGGDSWLAANRMTGNANLTASSASASNVSLSLQSKGTGAIDLAAGTSGVNISNGGTVTAITRTAAGTFYTSIPTLTVSAPTTAGGVQATATPQMAGQTVSVQAAGSGYVVGNTLTVVGGTSSTAAQLRVDSINGSGGVTATSFVNSAGAYSVLPTNPVSVTGGAGSGATFNITQWFFASVGPIITNAGSGYVEQPTVTFSGGGGSGAAAYATVGSIARLTSIGSGLEVAAASGIGFRVANSGTANVNYYSAQGNSSGGSVLLAATGTDTDISSAVSSKGAGSVRFQTNNAAQEQMRVAHTASAVNYVQVTGAATGSSPTISVQGSDASAGLVLLSKSASIIFQTRTAQGRSFNVLDTGAPVNYLQVQGNTATNAPILSAQGTDTNIDLTLTPKGTGNVRFGTYTGTILTPTGYVEIKDSGGTVRRLLVG